MSDYEGGFEMSYRRLSKEDCGDDEDCPSVWIRDADPEYVVIVGKVLPSWTVPVGADEVAVRLRRTTIIDADLG